MATEGPAGIFLYLDATLVASDTGPGSPQSFSGYWRWAADNLSGWPSRPSSDYVNAAIDEVAVHPNQLTAQQVAWHSHANH